jgi:hypothetical protein
MARVAGMRTLAVTACAQKVVEKPSASAAQIPARAEWVSERTVRLSRTSVSAANSAERKLIAVAGGMKNSAREISQLSRVYSAKPGGCATPSTAPTT